MTFFVVEIVMWKCSVSSRIDSITWLCKWWVKWIEYSSIFNCFFFSFYMKKHTIKGTSNDAIRTKNQKHMTYKMRMHNMMHMVKLSSSLYKLHGMHATLFSTNTQPFKWPMCAIAFLYVCVQWIFSFTLSHTRIPCWLQYVFAMK